MERFSFYAASAAFCLFLTVALTSAMTSDCLCDGLPGSQCDYCDQENPLGAAAGVSDMSAGFQGQYYDAWQQEHDEFHHQWVELHREFHEEEHTDAEHREFHRRMDKGHAQFHGILNGEAI
jgi:hypothetical protein